MNKNVLVIAFLLTTVSGISQNLETEIHKNKLANFLLIEQSLGSTKLQNKSNFLSEKGLAQPVEFRREQKGIPDLVVYYFYYQKDSVIDYILYEWDDNNFNNYSEIPKKSPEQIAAFIDKYQLLYNQLFKSYGKSESKGELTDTSKIETGKFWKEDSWDNADSSKIKLSMNISAKYEKKGAVTIPRTYRIRLYVLNTAGSNNDKLTQPDEAKIKSLDAAFKTFLSALETNNFENAKSDLASALSNKVTTQQLENLRSNIRFNDSLVIYLSGLQVGFNGSNYLMIQYMYKSDSNSPPKELIKVIFDETGKIMGLQPTRKL